MKLVLASTSPRRAEVLRAAGFSFETIFSTIDETPLSGEGAEPLVKRLALAKGRHAAERTPGPAMVLAADTVIELDGMILGKPRSMEDARAMLQRLSGRTHTVHTGVALIRLPGGESRVASESTRVTFAPLEPGTISEYLATGEPLDKAGAYAIQGRAGRFITRIEGCYFNVVGLPLARVCALMRELDWK